MTKEGALYKFWSSFGLPAFDEVAVPTGSAAPKLPYITYQVVTDTFGNQVSLTASLWDRDHDGYSAISANSKKAEEISKAIGEEGVFLKFDGGTIWLKRGSPFAQSLGDTGDDMIRRKFFNLIAEFISAD